MLQDPRISHFFRSLNEVAQRLSDNKLKDNYKQYGHHTVASKKLGVSFWGESG